MSLKDVVDGLVASRLITGRTVFVGAHSISAVPDDYPVPNAPGQKMFGVEIWANTAQSIFTNRYPVSKQGFFTTMLEVLIVTALGIYFVFRWHLRGFLGAIAALLAFTAGAYVLFGLQTQGVVGTGEVAGAFKAGCAAADGRACSMSMARCASLSRRRALICI